MLRITRLSGKGPVLTLKVEGALQEPWVNEMLHVCAQCASLPGYLRLDLSALTFVDGAGTQLLRALIHQGAEIAACSGFVKELLHLDRSTQKGT